MYLFGGPSMEFIQRAKAINTQRRTGLRSEGDTTGLTCSHGRKRANIFLWMSFFLCSDVIYNMHLKRIKS
jgi:hypothetical protein